MTPARKKILLAVAEHWKQHQVSPTFEELAAATGLRSLATVFKHVNNLVDSGYLTQARTLADHAGRRSLELTPKAITLFTACPLCGAEIRANGTV